MSPPQFSNTLALPQRQLSQTNKRAVAAILVLVPLFLFGGNSCAVNDAPNEQQSVAKASSKLDGILMEVYAEYQTHQASNIRGQTFHSTQTTLRILDEHIVIDAVAVKDPRLLEHELKELGAKSIAVAGLYVSCELPIVAIGRLAGLSSLKFARPVFEITR